MTYIKTTGTFWELSHSFCKVNGQKEPTPNEGDQGRRAKKPGFSSPLLPLETGRIIVLSLIELNYLISGFATMIIFMGTL